MSNLIEMTVLGKKIKMRRTSSLTIAEVMKINDVDVSGPLGEAHRAMRIFETCIVNDEAFVAEVFSSMQFSEFAEFIEEWSDLNSLNGTFD